MGVNIIVLHTGRIFKRYETPSYKVKKKVTPSVPLFCFVDMKLQTVVLCRPR